MSARPWSAAALLGTGPGAGSQAAAASQLPLRVPAERAMPRSSRDPCTKPHSQDTAHTLNPRPKSKRGRAGPLNSQHRPQTSEPASDGSAHPRQLFNATSEVCWINKYSRDTPGYVSFMSSLCYQKRHPLRGSDASITEIIFVMNNLFEKRVLIISRKNSKKKQPGLLCSAAGVGGMLQGQAGALVPEESQRVGRGGLGTKGSSNCCHSCARRRAGSALPARCAWKTPQMAFRGTRLFENYIKAHIFCKITASSGKPESSSLPHGTSPAELCCWCYVHAEDDDSNNSGILLKYFIQLLLC